VLASDELELSALRVRFLAVSEQIAELLNGLVKRIGNAPPATQASLLVSAGQIAAAQHRLREEADRLVGLPAERAAILQITLQAQLGASCQLANILGADQALSAQFANIAQQLAQFNRPPPIPRQSWQSAANPGGYDRFDYAMDPLTPDEETARRRDNDSQRRSRFGLSPISRALTSQSLTLVGSLLFGLLLAWARLPSEGDKQELAMRSLPTPEHQVAEMPPLPVPLAPPQQPRSQAADTTSPLPQAEASRGRDREPLVIIARVPEPMPPSTTADAASVRTPEGNVEPALPERNVGPIPLERNVGPVPLERNVGPVPPERNVGPVLLERNLGPVPKADTRPGPVPGPVALALPPPATNPTPATPNYVPVVFTHQDKDTAKRAFAELQRHYPKLLKNRQSEVQEVDMGKSGIWYRLFVLPPGTRQQATESCARLEAAGHDRCWVKEY